MSKKERCNRESIAYYSGLDGVEIKDIEFGIDDYIYCVSGAWGGKKRCHRLKVQTDRDGFRFIRIDGYKIPLDECIRMNA